MTIGNLNAQAALEALELENMPELARSMRLMVLRTRDPRLYEMVRSELSRKLPVRTTASYRSVHPQEEEGRRCRAATTATIAATTAAVTAATCAMHAAII